jgi:hypothetical protein
LNHSIVSWRVGRIVPHRAKPCGVISISSSFGLLPCRAQMKMP